MKKDPNRLIKIEKAVSEKYGDEAIVNPKSGWDKNKEKKYLKDLKSFYNRRRSKSKKEIVEGFLIDDKSSCKNRKIDRKCPVCEEYSFSVYDNVYMIKFSCCFGCYIKYVEDRELRWISGWRPEK